MYIFVPNMFSTGCKTHHLNTHIDMKKRILFSFIALCSAVFGAMAQRNYTFNAAALNVDGLPNEILSIEINPDGKEAAGATELCGILANSGWDIVGFSEDFNFHDYLVAAPASNYYNFGAHGGKVSNTSNSTDGLGFACNKRYTMSGGDRTKWNTLYGGSGLLNVGDNGADGMIDKGFRMYTVTLATGVSVDVYVLHMDANTADSDDDYDSNGRDKNIVAREAQLKQLADYIKNNHNNRPVIILGDTNCRYTREQLKAGFIDYINADARFTIKDAWVEHMWGGSYPTYGSGSIMTDAYGMQKGEVVDKVFYINTTESNLTLKSNSYLHDASVTVSDHKPVVVNFTLTDPNGTPLTDAEKEDNWTLEESVAGNKKPTWEGDEVVSGTTYYMMNVGTGEYIKWGGCYYTEGVAGNAGTPIKPITNGNVWNLQTSTIRDKYLGDGDLTYLDRPVGESNWYLEPVSGTAYQYRLKSSRNLYLTATTAEAHHPVKSEAYNANNENQKWVFLTDDRIRTEMAKANADYPFNFTALLKSADFDVIEYEDGWTNNWDGFDWSGGGTGNCSGNGPFMATSTGWSQTDPSLYVTYAYANSTSATTMSQNLGTLPNGTYNISFEGFYRSRYSYKGGFMNLQTKEADETRNAVVSFGSTNIAIPQNTSTTIGSGVDVVGPLFRDGDTYLKSQQVTMNSSSSVTLKVTKPATSSTQVAAWICIDNFRLIYYGTGEAPKDPYKEYKDKVCAKVNETYPLVMALNVAGQATYDITTVISRYDNNQITTGADAQAMCNIVDAAYANALVAHNAYNVEQVIKNMEANGGDITGAIINPSFETGDLTGWTVGGGNDVGVYPNSNGTYTISNCDGTYLFNSWNGDDNHGSSVKQTITGVPNGLYELKAVLGSFGTADGKSHDYHMYLIGNDYHTSVVATGGKTIGQEATLYFLVEDGTATIGAIGGNKGGGSEFIHYWPGEGCFLKADNFRLKYICDVPHGRLKLALNDVETANLDEYGKASLNISTYQNAYDNKSLTTDGKEEVTAVHNALQAAVKAQRTAGADMTWAIANPSFETGDYTGWSTTVGWDTGVKPQENGTYTTAGTDGRYLFNTWNNDGNATNSGVNAAITQTVTGIPNGTYRLTAMVASDNGNSLMLTGNGVTTTISASTNGTGSGVFPSVECVVTDGKLNIEVKGSNNCWYKCDDFRLTYLAPIAVESVTLSQNVATLIEGNALDLTATVTPDYATDKTVTWSSSDEEVATVDEKGNITAVAPGTVTITATAGAVKAICEVTVEATSYVFTLQVEGKEYFTKTIKRGTELATEMVSVEQPVKEGHTFSGWNVPATMPEEDLTLNGTFIINSYLVTFKIGEEVISSEELAYGTEIVAPEAPEKEGYTFDGWGKVDATVPVGGATYEGTYTANIYTVTFKIGDDVILSEELAYGTAIVAPEAPEKEGYTFSGWGDVDATVPVDGATYQGAYTAKIYTVIFKIGDDVISSEELAYGTAIVAPEAPEKEGYTFSGWVDVDATVPAEDVTYEGSYTVNKYTVTYYVDGEVVNIVEVEYGAEIPEYVYEELGDPIKDWKIKDEEQDYITMPAKDIAYTGSISSTGINGVNIDEDAVIYDLSGRRVLKAVKGFYIINGKKVLVK